MTDSNTPTPKKKTSARAWIGVAIVIGLLWIIGAIDQRTNTSTTTTNATTTNTPPPGKVVVKSHQCQKDQIVGEVENQTGLVADFVEVTATLYATDGSVVDTDSTYTNPTTVPAGETSPFKMYLLDPKPYDTCRLTTQWR